MTGTSRSPITTTSSGGGVLAIDGPAGSGKSTVARRVARELDLEMLDTGAMYRSVTWASIERGVDPHDDRALGALAGALRIELADGSVTVDGVDCTSAIRGPEVNALVSVVSAQPSVRRHLVAVQRSWMQRRGGGVVEGRDIGTVVFPDASLKVFLTASPLVRAGRRSAERSGEELAAIASEIERRDHIDSTRHDSPLRQADNAMVLDTSDLSIDDVVSRIASRYREVTAGAGS